MENFNIYSSSGASANKTIKSKGNYTNFTYADAGHSTNSSTF